MSIYDPVNLVAEGLKLLPRIGTGWNAPRSPNNALIRETLDTTPNDCGNLTSAADLAICVDAYCDSQSKNGSVNPDADIPKLWTSLEKTLKSPHMIGLPDRAVVGRILNTFKDQLCKDGPPPPSVPVPVLATEPVALPNESPVHNSDCGYAIRTTPGAKTAWGTVAITLLGYGLLRGIQLATGSFFTFFAPNLDNKYNYKSGA